MQQQCSRVDDVLLTFSTKEECFASCKQCGQQKAYTCQLFQGLPQKTSTMSFQGCPHSEIEQGGALIG